MYRHIADADKRADNKKANDPGTATDTIDTDGRAKKLGISINT